MERQRQSNFELMRIVSMLLIILYHCALHTEITDVGTLLYVPFCRNQVFIYLFGMWGMAGVGCFFLLTAYFMLSNGKTRTKRLFLLVLQTVFWALVLEIVVICLLAKRPYTVNDFLHAVISPFHSNYWFITAYLGLVLLSPFLKRIIEVLDETLYRKLLIVLTIVSPLFSTLGDTRQTLCDLSIGIYYFLLWGYLQRYPNNWFERNRVKIFFSVFLFSVCSACISSYFFMHLNMAPSGLATISGRASILQVLLAVSLFYMFKRIDIGSIPWINYVSQGVFGVYLIHENQMVYPILWNEIIPVGVWFRDSKLFPLQLLGCVLLIFVIALILDLIRLYLLEKPVTRLLLPVEPLFLKLDHWLNE